MPAYEIEERVSVLETVLESFIISTNAMMSRIERDIEKMNKTTKQNTDEMKKNIEEMTKEREERKREREEDREEMRKDREERKKEREQRIKDIEEMKKDTKEMKKKWGELANKWGTVVEDIVAPNIPSIAKEYFHIEEFDLFAIRVRRRNTIDRSLSKEFDVIAISEDFFIVNETKSTQRPEYIHEFIDSVKKIYEYFPEYKDKKLIPIFASLNFSDEIVLFLTRNRIFAMGMRDDNMELVNFDRMNLVQ